MNWDAIGHFGHAPKPAQAPVPAPTPVPTPTPAPTPAPTPTTAAIPNTTEKPLSQVATEVDDAATTTTTTTATKNPEVATGVDGPNHEPPKKLKIKRLPKKTPTPAAPTTTNDLEVATGGMDAKGQIELERRLAKLEMENKKLKKNQAALLSKSGGGAGAEQTTGGAGGVDGAAKTTTKNLEVATGAAPIICSIALQPSPLPPPADDAVDNRSGSVVSFRGFTRGDFLSDTKKERRASTNPFDKDSVNSANNNKQQRRKSTNPFDDDRDDNNSAKGDTTTNRVTGLEYSCYRPMAIKQLTSILEALPNYLDHWRSDDASIQSVSISHSVDCLVPLGKASFSIVVASSHRGEGLRALEWLLTEVKAKVPIWKKELYDEVNVKWCRNKEWEKGV